MTRLMSVFTIRMVHHLNESVYLSESVHPSGELLSSLISFVMHGYEVHEADLITLRTHYCG